ARADLAGTYIGPGGLEYPGNAESCTVSFSIEQTETAVVFYDYAYYCDETYFDYDSFGYAIEGGRLLDNGVDVGSITNDGLEVASTFDDGTTYSFSLHWGDGDVLHLRDSVDGVDGYTATAR